MNEAAQTVNAEPAVSTPQLVERNVYQSPGSPETGLIPYPDPNNPGGYIQVTKETASLMDAAKRVAKGEAPKVEPEPVVEPLRELDGRVSPFRSKKNSCAGRITINGNTFYYKEMPDSLQEFINNRPQFLADKLGITLDEFSRDDFRNAKIEEVNRVPEYTEDTYNRVLCECLVHWDVVDENDKPVPITKENIGDMYREVKAEIVSQIQRSTQFGISFATFRKLSSDGI